jgi:hypothetical protein
LIFIIHIYLCKNNIIYKCLLSCQIYYIPFSISHFYHNFVGHQITQSQVTTSAGSGNGATTITSSSQLANQQQISPTGQQLVRLQNMVQSPTAIQTIQGIQGVNAGTTAAVQGIQTAGSGVAISGATNAANQQQIITLPNGQQMAVRMATGGVATPQMFQMPQQQMVQQMMQVQVPVSQNGQTVLQTVQVPVQMAQPAAPQYAQIPQLVQTASGQQQIVMQQVQIAQPQQQIQAAPQFAQIITPNGQIQQVQVLGGMGNMQQAGQMIGSIQGIGGIQAMSIPQQLATVQAAGQNIQTQQSSPNVSNLSSTSSSVSSSTTPAGSTSNSLPTPKSEPQDQNSDTHKTPTIISPAGGVVQPGQAVQLVNMKNQQVVVQQQAPGTAVAAQPTSVVSVRTANGQIVQVCHVIRN